MNNLLIKDTKKMPYSRFEKNCSTNKSVKINNVYHYQQHIVERYQIYKNPNETLAHIQAKEICRKTF